MSTRLTPADVNAALPAGWRANYLQGAWLARRAADGAEVRALTPLDLVAAVGRYVDQHAVATGDCDDPALAACPRCCALTFVDNLCDGGCLDCTVPDAVVADCDVAPRAA